MDRARDQLLAGAGLARDQHGRCRRRDARDAFHHAAQCGGAAQDVSVPRRGGGRGQLRELAVGQAGAAPRGQLSVSRVRDERRVCAHVGLPVCGTTQHVPFHPAPTRRRSPASCWSRRVRCSCRHRVAPAQAREPLPAGGRRLWSRCRAVDSGRGDRSSIFPRGSADSHGLPGRDADRVRRRRRRRRARGDCRAAEVRGPPRGDVRHGPGVPGPRPARRSELPRARPQPSRDDRPGRAARARRRRDLDADHLHHGPRRHPQGRHGHEVGCYGVPHQALRRSAPARRDRAGPGARSGRARAAPRARRAPGALPVAHSARARGDGPRGVRDAQQAGRVGARDQRGHGQDPARTGHEEDGGAVARRPRQDGRELERAAGGARHTKG